MNLVYLNGQFLPPNEARISVFDRGFLFGDGIYDVMSVYHGKLFHFDKHWQRIQQQLAFLQMTLSLSADEALAIATQLIASLDSPHQSLYWQITRGLSQPRKHTFDRNTACTVFAYSTPLVQADWKQLQQGYKAITATDTRWKHAEIKSISLLANILLRQQAQQQQAVDAILIREGYAIEGASSNLFIVKNKQLITPPASDAMVPGITRDVVLECAQALSLPVLLQNISIAELYEADEIWLTGSSKEIIPITQLNDTTIATGRAGPLWTQMIHQYRALTKHEQSKLNEVSL